MCHSYSGCDTGPCDFEATGDIYYTGFDDATKDEIMDAFFDWLLTLYPDLVLNTPTDNDKANPSIGQSNQTGQKGVVVEDTGSSTNVGLIVAGTLVALVGVGAAFFMRSRARGRRSNLDEDQSLVMGSNDKRNDDASIGFPVSSNSLNNEYEVLGKEIY